MFKHILLPTDGSPLSEVAIKKGMQFARSIGAQVTGLHVMRREKGFGEAYGKNRAGEWEYVEYRPDGSYQTPPQKSGSCAECHVKAGQQRDFVYRGRLPEKLVQ